MGGWAPGSQAQPVVDRGATICRIDTKCRGATFCRIDTTYGRSEIHENATRRAGARRAVNYFFYLLKYFL